MWLEHIHNLLEETNMNDLNCDLPMAIFMIKLLFTRIKFDNFTNKSHIDYVKSHQFIELRYFIQSTIKEEIEEECVLKEKAIEDEIKGILKISNQYDIGLTINWARSVIEGRSVNTPIQHLKLASSKGLFKAITIFNAFSICSRACLFSPNFVYNILNPLWI